MEPARVVKVVLIALSLFVCDNTLPDQRVTIAAAQEMEEHAEPASGEGDLVIPPGQEELLADMLGRAAELPDGCQLVSGQVDYRVVRVKYKCPAGETVFELVHPTQADGAVKSTDRFAINVKSGSPPDSLVAALESRIRSKEGGFEWQLIEPNPHVPGGPGGTHGGQSVSWVRLGIAGLFVVAIIGWIVRKRGAGKQGAE